MFRKCQKFEYVVSNRNVDINSADFRGVLSSGDRFVLPSEYKDFPVA